MPRTRLLKFLAVATIAVLSATTGQLAQAQTAQAAPPTLESQLRAEWRTMHEKLLQMAKDPALSPDRLEARPHPASRTILDELRHVTIGIEYANTLLQRKPFDWTARERADDKKPRGRALLVSEMEAALAASWPLVDASPRPFLMGLIAHQGEHYGKLVSNYRMIGLVPPASRVAAPEKQLEFMAGTFRVHSADSADTVTYKPGTEWRAGPIIGGKYMELAGVLGVEFRVTIGFDATTDRYRMSLLDAGSGVFDVYEGSADASGSLVLTNPQYWRATITPTQTGWRWLYERSPDRGVTWRKSGPGAELIRVNAGAP